MTQNLNKQVKEPAWTAKYRCLKCGHLVVVSIGDYYELVRMTSKLERIVNIPDTLITPHLVEMTMKASENRCCEVPWYNLEQ